MLQSVAQFGTCILSRYLQENPRTFTPRRINKYASSLRESRRCGSKGNVHLHVTRFISNYTRPMFIDLSPMNTFNRNSRQNKLSSFLYMKHTCVALFHVRILAAKALLSVLSGHQSLDSLQIGTATMPEGKEPAASNWLTFVIFHPALA